jgi:hypothetical protein
VGGRALLEQSLAMYRALGDGHGAAGSLNGLAMVAMRQGDGTVARALLEESLDIYRELADRWGVAISLEGFARLATAGDQPARGAALWAAADALRQALGTPRPPRDQADSVSSIGALRAALGEEAFAAAWAEGRTLPLEAAIQLALDARR